MQNLEVSAVMDFNLENEKTNEAKSRAQRKKINYNSTSASVVVGIIMVCAVVAFVKLFVNNIF